ncbi:MAG: glycosyltransferase [Bacteroidetes bacterium]|nr:glycosyltransferase [Bacteroidota bacterium]
MISGPSSDGNKLLTRQENFKILHQGPSGSTKKLCLFASFSFTGQVNDYVFYYLEQIRKAGYEIFFISTRSLTDECIHQLAKSCQMVIERQNEGLDFASWQTALKLIDYGKDCEAILLANDSVFGPFHSLSAIISSVEKRFDVCGMTDSYEVDYHIQSYFLHFNKKVISSAVWRDFWQAIDSKLAKTDIINEYEVGLSTRLIKAGFKVGAYAPIDLVSRSVSDPSRFVNSSIAYWRELIEKFQFPFLKREILINPTVSKVYWHLGRYISLNSWRKVIQTETTYPIRMIDNFLADYTRHYSVGSKRAKVQKKKILFLAHTAEIGGAQKVLLNFQRWLSHNTDIPFETIFCYFAEREAMADEFSALGTTTRFWALQEHEKTELKDRLAEEQIGLVFSNTFVNVEVQKFVSFLKAPQIVFGHELKYVLDRFPIIKDNEEWIRQNVNHFIACAGVVKNMIIDYFGVNPTDVSVINEFIEDVGEKISQKNNPKKDLPKYGIPSNAFIVGMSGTFEWRKSADLIPVIANTLCSRHQDIHLVWVGADKSSDLYKSIQLDLEKSGLGEKVHFFAKQMNPYPIYSAFDVFLMPSREDPFPLVNLEAGLLGKPVICFEGSGGSQEYVGFGTGNAIPYMDFNALKTAVFDYYNNPDQLKLAAVSIPPIVRSNFLTAVQAPRLLEKISDFYDVNEVVPDLSARVTIMTHIFYDTTWNEFKQKLKNFENENTNLLFSISEDCLIKEKIVEDIRRTFNNAYALITSNVGKDVGGKMALIDLYLTLGLSSDYIILLHDKQSPQTLVGDSWRKNLLKILDRRNTPHILHLFENDQKIGVIGAKEHIINEWDNNTQKFRHNDDLVKTYLKKYNIRLQHHEYISGTMYWMRASIIESFFKKNNPIELRSELEAGNVLDNHGSTIAHTWERMFCWLGANQGYKIHGI